MKTEYDFSKGERGRFYRENAKLVFPASGEKPNWIGPEGRIGKLVVEEAKRTLEAYAAQLLKSINSSLKRARMPHTFGSVSSG